MTACKSFLSCQKGYFSSTGASLCTKCPIGTYSDMDGGTSCIDVPAGFYGTGCDENMTACKSRNPCPVGYFSSTAASFCTKCPIGRYSDSMGAPTCTFVPGGTYSSECDNNMTACKSTLPCPSGHYCRKSSRMPRECISGKYAEDVGSVNCINCAPGRFASENGSIVCNPCIEGRYNPIPGQNKCSICRASTTSLLGATKCSSCQPGKFGNESGLCYTCSKNTYSNNEGTTQCDDCEEGKFSDIGAVSCKEELYTLLLDVPSKGTAITEGGTFSYEISLTKSPDSEVQLNISTKSNSNNCNLFPNTALFTKLNYNEKLEIQVSTKVNEESRSTLGSEEYKCNIYHKFITNDVKFQHSRDRKVDISVLSKGCGTGEFLGVYKRMIHDECVCNEKYYLPVNKGECTLCPIEANCTRVGVTLASISSAEGFWRNSNSSTTFEKCHSKDYCVGGSIMNRSQCFQNHTGPLCEVCIDGNEKQGRNKTCQVCDEKRNENAIAGMLALLGFCMYVAVLLFVLHVPLLRYCTYCGCYKSCSVNKKNGKVKSITIKASQKKARQSVVESIKKIANINSEVDDIGNEAPDSIIEDQEGNVAMHISSWRDHVIRQARILIGYYQILSHLDLTFDVPWPEQFLSFIKFFSSLINIDVEAILRFFDVCRLSISFLKAFYIHMLVLPTFLLILAVAAASASVIKRIYNCIHKEKRSTEKQGSVIERSIASIMFVIFLIYPGLTVRIFRIFRCQQLGANGEWYLNADYSVVCYEGEHRVAMNWAFFYAPLYVVGIPVIMLFELWRHRKIIMHINNYTDIAERMYHNELKEGKVKGKLDFNQMLHLKKMQKVLHLRKGRRVAKIIENDDENSIEQRKKRWPCFFCYRIALPDDENEKEKARKSTILQYGSLFQGYEDDVWYWEIFEMFRK